MEHKKIFHPIIHWIPRKDCHGFALLYVMGALLIVTFLGSALINISQKDVVSATDYSAMTTAAISAKSAMQASVAKIEFQSSDVLNILNNYLDAGYSGADKGWLVGDANTYVTLDNQQKYRVKILGLDKTNHTIQLAGTGVGKGNSKKNVFGIYELDGIQFKTITTPGNEHALFLGTGGTNTFNTSISVEGDIFVGDDAIFYGDASGTTFNGRFITPKNTTKTIRMDGDYTFKDVAYFGTNLDLYSYAGDLTMRLEKESGFEGLVNFIGPHQLDMYGNTYFNNNFSGDFGLKANLNENDFHHDGDVTNPTQWISNYNDILDDGSNIDIPDELGISTATAPLTPGFIEGVITPTSDIYSWNALRNTSIGGYQCSYWDGIDGELANNIYDKAGTDGKRWNGFAVVKIESGVTMSLRGASETFTGNIIFIVEGKMAVQVGGGIYRSGDPSCTVIYVKNGGTAVLGGWPSAYPFRGYIYNTTGGTLTMGQSGYEVYDIVGAIHNVATSGGFQWYPNPGITGIKYDQALMSTLSSFGLVTNVFAGTTTNTNTLELVTPGGAIDAIQLGLCF